MKAAFVALVLLVGASGLAVAGEQPQEFKITTKRKDDAVEVRAEKDTDGVLGEKPVRDQPGGRRAEGREVAGSRGAAAAPEGAGELPGLERQGHAGCGGVDSGRASRRCGIWKDGKEDAPLDEKSPFWMDIRILTGDGKPAKELPLKDGYFEMALPKAFFEGNPKSITLNWIDFYR